MFSRRPMAGVYFQPIERSIERVLSAGGEKSSLLSASELQKQPIIIS